MTQSRTAYFRSPVGYLKITGSDAGIGAIDFLDAETVPDQEIAPCLRACVRQLQEYFDGTRTTFELRLQPEGTDFQHRVWQALRGIPYGQTTTYGAIADRIGNRKAIRAVGAANGRNRIPIVIPCHRVIGSDGSLIGFGGGIWRKEFLLRHENALMV